MATPISIEEEGKLNLPEIPREILREIGEGTDLLSTPTPISIFLLNFMQKKSIPMPTRISISQLILSLMRKNAISSSTRMEEEETETLNLPELPREVWREIGTRNPSRLDVTRFRSVCQTWRSSLPPPSRFPLQIPAPPGPSVKHATASYFISEVTFYATSGATDQRPMIVAFEEEYRGGKFSSSAFLHRTQVHHTKLSLPPFSKLSPTLSFLANAHHVHNAFPRSKKKSDAGKYNFSCNSDVLKTVIVSNPSSACCNPSYARLCDLKVVAHLRDMKLAVLSLAGGAMNNVWDTTSAGSSTFEDIISYKGQLYAVDRSGAAFVMDYNSLRMTQFTPAVPNFTVPNPRGNRKVLHLMMTMARKDSLFMFCHEPTTVPHPTLYKLSFRIGMWLDARYYMPTHVFVKDLKCNFAVPRDLIRRYTHNNRLLKVPRFCSWPSFSFFRIAVGFKNTYDPYGCHKLCDNLQIPYSYGETLVYDEEEDYI